MTPLADSARRRAPARARRRAPCGAVRSASLGSRSVPALKAFLQGEQLYRRGDWDAAIEAYRRATELDTGSRSPTYHRADAEGWQRASRDTLSNTLSLRAGALNHGLSPRESLLVVAESLEAAAILTLRRPRHLAPPQAPARLWRPRSGGIPTDAEAWYALAEARYHYSWGRG